MRFLLTMVLALLVLIADDGVDAQRGRRCHPSYRRACVPIVDHDINCAVVWRRGICNLPVVGPDDYLFDGNYDGVACECVSMRYWQRRRHSR